MRAIVAKTRQKWSCFITYLVDEAPETYSFDFYTNDNNVDNAYDVATKMADAAYDPDYADLIVIEAGLVTVRSN